ncbi:MAG: hypothetical protein HYW01_06070 [Deltaproteobacteria bacterium]|nr:hypothetical protein [Deltaproteobacteria bacterium]
MREERLNGSLFVTVILALIVLVAVFLVIPSMQKESAEEKNILLKEPVRLSNLSTSVVSETEAELNKRLLDSRIKPLFYKVSIQGDKINIFLDRNGWRDLSLSEKADLLLQVANIYGAIIENSVWIPQESKNTKAQIHFYDRASNKELASWAEEGGIILD